MTVTLDFIIFVSIPQKHRQPVHVSLKHDQDLEGEEEESDQDLDEVEELRVDSDMERDKDAEDEADREEGDYKITFKPIIKKIMNK